MCLCKRRTHGQYNQTLVFAGLKFDIMKRVGSNKVLVQLLKNVPGLGVRGELVKVAPGRMRNELHAQNGAAYVLKDMKLRIPRVMKPVEEVFVRTEKTADAAAADAAAAAEAKAERVVSSSLFGLASKTSVDRDTLSFLKFPSQVKKDSSAPVSGKSSELDALALINMLPPSIQWGQASLSGMAEDGKLETPISLEHVAQHLTKLVGHPIYASNVSIQVVAQDKLGGDKVRNVSKTLSLFKALHIDYCGDYTVVVTMGGAGSVSRKLVVGDGARHRPSTVAVAPPTAGAGTGAGSSASSASVEAGKPAEEPTNAQDPTEPGFEWNNQLIEKFLKK